MVRVAEAKMLLVERDSIESRKPKGWKQTKIKYRMNEGENEREKRVKGVTLFVIVGVQSKP